MPEINWDITPGWGGTGRLSKFAGRRKTKEWNLIGALFTAATAERYDLVNRLCDPDNLQSEVDALVEVLLSRDQQAITVTKYFVDKGADLTMENSLAFEGAPQRGGGQSGAQGIADFADRAARESRRALVKNFWQD
jgi:enoyl-CoA hydratase